MTEKFRSALRAAVKLVTTPGINYQLMLHRTTLEVATDASDLKGGISSINGKHKFSVPFQGHLWEKLNM